LNVFVAIPALNENDHIQGLIGDLGAQSFQDFRIYICVNNPDEWWNDPVKKKLCENNLETIEYIKNIRDLNITLTDRASEGNGWKGKRRGVGYARKVLFEAINSESDDDDIVISLDADTRIRRGYIESVRDIFRKNKKTLLLANPYYHELIGNESVDRAILRYELYMRYYLLNLMKVYSPYAFTAMGSAISFRIGGYRKISGITPKQAGEDFYFVNRMKKAGDIMVWNEEAVYPSARESDRVPFGTGPAVSKGMSGDWESYPFYDIEAFSRIGETYRLLPELFRRDVETPVDGYLYEAFGKNIWEPLRNNFKTEKLFIRACHEKIDGLRILQILRYYQKGNSLKNFIRFSNSELGLRLKYSFDFDSTSVDELDGIRNRYFGYESEMRKKYQIN